jgi:(1->4)-alpha-D-glucan 1-alpha-D-glucosylmutase
VRGGEVLVAVTRCSTGVADGWGDTSVGLPEGEWRDAFGGDAAVLSGTVGTAGLFERLPVAVMERVG